ncbi:hypothetical protein DL991_32330 [Amycolatopsis sp. WAC 01375]|nr:hypothetical protein DL991_32330 [Amycolatopsis sp. WAC 01375]RSN27227.1 hypothetical protein DL990_28880 [Amycolatopsis sp. WAC 01416]
MQGCCGPLRHPVPHVRSEESVKEWPTGLQDELLRVGWSPERRVDTSEWRSIFEPHGLEMFPAAEDFLSRFGGLSFEKRPNGVDSYCFQFELDPRLCAGEEDLFLDWGKTMGKAWFPLGEYDNSRFFLAIDEDAVIYTAVNWIARFGRGVEGLAAIVFGVLPEPLEIDAVED